MAGTSQKTTTVGVRVPNETLGEWQGDAQQLGMPISGYVLARAQSGAVEVSGSVVGPVVYFIQAGENGPVKIGWSKKITERVAGLQVGNPVKLTILRTVVAEPWVESWFHDEFDELRLQGEWFSFDEKMLSLLAPAEKPALLSKRITKPESSSVTFRIPSDLLDRIKVRAATGGESVSALLVLGAQIVVGDAEPSRFAEGIADELAVAHEQFRIAERGLAELGPIAERLAEAELRVAELSGVTADLERQLGTWQARAERAEQAAKVIAHSKPVTSVLPASDGFAARPVGSLLKSAGKPKGKKK